MATRLCTEFETAVARAYAGDTRANAATIARDLGAAQPLVSRVLIDLFSLNRNAAREAVRTGVVREPSPAPTPRTRRTDRAAVTEPTSPEPAASTRVAAALLATEPATPAGKRLKAHTVAAISPAAAAFTEQMAAVETAGPASTEDLEALKTSAVDLGRDVAAAAANWPERTIDAGAEWIADHDGAMPEPVELELSPEPPTQVAPDTDEPAPAPPVVEPEPAPWDLPARRARQAKHAAPDPAGEVLIAEYSARRCAGCGWIGQGDHRKRADHPLTAVLVRIIDPRNSDSVSGTAGEQR